MGKRIEHADFDLRMSVDQLRERYVLEPEHVIVEQDTHAHAAPGRRYQAFQEKALAASGSNMKY